MASASFSDIVDSKSAGITSLICKKGSNNFITCGTEGVIYVWDERTFTEKSNPGVKNVGEATHFCAAWKGDSVYYGYTDRDLVTDMDRNCLAKVPFDDWSSPVNIFNFGSNPTAVDVSEKYIVAASSDFNVRIAKVSSPDEMMKLEIMEGEVIDVKIDPTEKYLAAAVVDGSVQIFSTGITETKDMEPIAVVNNVFVGFNTIDVQNPLGRMAWSADGKHLFVPAKGSVKAISATDWTVEDKGFKAPKREMDTFSTCCLSADRSVLAASTLTGHVCLWAVDGRTHLSSHEYKRISPGRNIITSIAFSPFDPRSIIIADANRGICLLRNAAPPSTKSSGAVMDVEMEEETERKKTKKRILESDDEGEEDEESSKRPEEIFLDDAADEDTNMSCDIGAIKRKHGFHDTLEDFGFLPTSRNATPSGAHLSGEPIIQKVTKVVEYDPPSLPAYFVSGASPSNVHCRYLKWNAYGVVRSINKDDYNGLEIDYHDQSISSEIRMDNSATNYTLADLTDKAVALANVSEDENEASELLVIHIASWDVESRRWSTKLPLKEAPVDVLVSRKMIAVLTDKRNIRLFTLAGTQRHIVTHPGVALTATCFDSKFALVSIAGSEFFEEKTDEEEKRKPQHQYVATVYDLDSKHWFQEQTNVATVNLAVGPREHVAWLAYTNEGKLCTMDSAYTVRLLTKGGLWMPIFQGEAKAKSDAIWPISVVEGRQRQFRYLYCRGSKYPLMELKIPPSIAQWALPLCQPDVPKTKLEQDLLFNEVEQNDAYSDPDADIMGLAKTHLTSLVQLFALACKSERETRAWELAHLVRSSKGIQAMCKIAFDKKKTVLSEKVAAVGRENVSSASEQPVRKASSTDNFAPRRVSLQRRSDTSFLSQNDSILGEVVEEEERETEEQRPSQQDLDSTLNTTSGTQIPVRRENRNPFKRAAESALDSSSLSVFDQLESSFDNPKKRAREEETSSPVPSKKQAKLSFGFGQQKGKENGVTAYTLWLQENEAELKKTFSGGSDEFDKFCVGQFRVLSAAEKKEWRARAADTAN